MFHVTFCFHFTHEMYYAINVLLVVSYDKKNNREPLSLRTLLFLRQFNQTFVFIYCPKYFSEDYILSQFKYLLFVGYLLHPDSVEEASYPYFSIEESKV